MSTASILHADLDSFFASVEQRDEPALRGRPTIVGAGVVLAASYEAKAFGVYTPMPLRAARKLCPHAHVVRPRFDAYLAASRAVFRLFNDTTPLVEGLSIDEAFLDVRGMERSAGSPLAIAQRLRRRVRDETGLPLSIGIARTKFLAKVASGVAKPDGLLAVDPQGELEFLHPLPVERLWGVGPVTARKLHDWGLLTVGQVAEFPCELLEAMLGTAAGRQLHALAHNRDPRRVHTGKRRGSIGSQRARGRRPWTPEELERDLAALVDRVTRRARRARRVGRTVTLRLRFDDFTRATRSRTLPQATASTETILRAARELLVEALPILREQGVTLIGVALSNLEDADRVQLAIPFDDSRLDELDRALDEVRERYGSRAVMRAAGLTLGERDELVWPDAQEDPLL
ncbi:MAG TPA: DNA polymerase IV [Gaiellaceae bacterium]|nr:DNA polymerase IV [Gaiellaceae bacterium]